MNEYDYAVSKPYGDSGEEKFYEKYPEKLERTDGIYGDFIIKGSGYRVELKTDYWDPESTENVFIEAATEHDDGVWKPSGVPRAVQDGSKYFCYWFIKNGDEYWYDTRLLMKFLLTEPTKNRKWLKQVINKKSDGRYRTWGYAIPRSELVSCQVPSPLEE